jgi:hypothetical protein
MAVDLIITHEAERDIAEAYAWYEEQRIGLGEEFLASSRFPRSESMANSPALSLAVHGRNRPLRPAVIMGVPL